jgi:hypothetical protein
MDAPIEIRYAGVVIAKASEILRVAGNDSGMFLVVPDPLPVGTVVELGDGVTARIEKVQESTDPRASGIYVRLLAQEEANLPWVPQLPDTLPLPEPRVQAPITVRGGGTNATEGPVSVERRSTIMVSMPPPVEAVTVASLEPERPARVSSADASPPVDRHQAPAEREPDRYREPQRRPTLVMAVPPPPEPLPAAAGAMPTAVKTETSGEFSARLATSSASGAATAAPASIVIEAEEPGEGEGDLASVGPVVEARLEETISESGPVSSQDPQLSPGEASPASVEDLPPARPLPAPDGRRKTGRGKRRNTTGR